MKKRFLSMLMVALMAGAMMIGCGDTEKVDGGDSGGDGASDDW